MDYKIKLGAVLRFDYTYEKDIIEQVEKLISRHKLGPFISRLIRAAFDNPKLMELSGLHLDEFGVSPERVSYFKEVESDMLKMRIKVDKIYEMALEMHTMAKFGKKMGLEGRVNNIMKSQFILQRQIEELSKILGISNIGHIFESNKLSEIEDKVEDILEYILISYEDIVEELLDNIKEKNSIVPYNKTIESVELNNEKTIRNKELEFKKDNNTLEDKGTQTKDYSKYMETNNIIYGNKDSEVAADDVDRVENFGQKADLDALTLFLGSKG